MGQINSSFGPLATQLTVDSVAEVSTGADDLRKQRQVLTKATNTLNDAGFAGAGREVTFSLDTATKQAVIKVIDAQSREVVAQLPAEYVLRMAEELNQLKRNSG